MRNYRLLSVFLILLLAMQSFVFVSAEESETVLTAASAEAEAVAAYLLGADYFKGDKVTRAEFTGALVKSFAIGTDVSFEKVYDDVSETNPYAREITAAYRAGIISPASKFEPDSPLLYEQAIKMVVVAIGYGNVGEYYGGYPSGYLKAANSIKLLKNVGSTDGVMTPADVMELLYNLLTSNVQFTGIVDDTVRYERGSEDYMYSIHGLTMAEGVVTATKYNSYRPGSAIIGDGFLEVEGVPYKCDITNPDMLGLNVCIYYDKYNNARIIIPADNEEITFGGDDIASFDGAKISYYNEGGKIKTETVTGASVVYNGRVKSGFDLSDIKGDYVTVRLVNNDEDRAFEYMFVYDFTYLYADLVDTRANSVSDSNGSVYLFESEEYDTEELVYSALGEQLEFADIKTGDLLSVAMSADNALATVYKCGTTVSGTITAMSDEYVEIDGTEYKLSGYASANYGASLVPGSDGMYIIGRADDVVVVNAQAAVMEYGYLIDAVINEGLESSVMIKVYTDEGEIEIYSADKVFYDGSRTYVRSEEILEPLTVNGEIAPQFIRYRTDAEGEKIVNIDLAETEFEFESEPASEKDTLRKYTFRDSSGAEVTSFNYRSSGKSCSPYFNVDGTVIFSVPKDDKIKTADKSQFSVASSDALSNNRNYTFSVYDLNEQGTAGAIVLKGQRVSPRQQFIIESALRGLLPDGGEGYVLHTYGNRAYNTYYLREEDVEGFGKIPSGGDIVEFSAGSDGIISEIVLVFDASGDVPVPNTSATNEVRFENPTNNSYYYGALYSRGTAYGYISKTTDGNGSFVYSFDKLMNLKLNTTNMAVINKKRNEVRPITLKELKDYKTHGDGNYYVVAYMSYQSPSAVYVYER